MYPELKKKKGPRSGPFVFFGAPGEMERQLCCLACGVCRRAARSSVRTPDHLVRSQVLHFQKLCLGIGTRQIAQSEATGRILPR